MLHASRSQFMFMSAILLGVFVLAFFVVKPFLYPIILAVALAVACKPIHRKMSLLMGNRPATAAALTTLIIILFIFIPLAFFGVQLVKEAKLLYMSLVENGGHNEIADIVNAFVLKMQTLLPNTPNTSTLPANIDEYLKQGLGWMIQNLGALFSNIMTIVLDSFILIATMYYFLKDGKKLKTAIITLSPLAETYDLSIFHKMEQTMNSVVKGSLFVALIQGALTITGFALFGIPNAILFGSMAIIASLIPSIGTALILSPAVVFLFVTGNVPAAIGLLTWGVVAVGLVDNILGPKLIGNKAQLHPFLTLLSVFGGIAFFGPIGLLLGPMIISLLSTLFEFYVSLKARDEQTA